MANIWLILKVHSLDENGDVKSVNSFNHITSYWPMIMANNKKIQ